MNRRLAADPARDRLTVPLIGLRVGMVAQIPEQGYKWMRLDLLTGVLRSGGATFRDASGAFVADASRKVNVPIRLLDEGPFRVKPHFGMIEPGDVVVVASKTVTVLEVQTTSAGLIELWGTYMPKRAQKGIVMGFRMEFAESADVVAFREDSEFTRARSLRAGHRKLLDEPS